MHLTKNICVENVHFAAGFPFYPHIKSKRPSRFSSCGNIVRSLQGRFCPFAGRSMMGTHGKREKGRRSDLQNAASSDENASTTQKTGTALSEKRRRHRRPPDGIPGGNVLEYPEKTNDQRLLLWERNRPASVSTVPMVERSVSGSLSTMTDTATVITGTR